MLRTRLPIQNSGTTSAIRQTSGTTMAAMVITMAPAVSPVETMGLARPAVTQPDFARTSALRVFVRAAMPPPPITATGHLMLGGMSTIAEALARTPARTAAGLAIT